MLIRKWDFIVATSSFVIILFKKAAIMQTFKPERGITQQQKLALNSFLVLQQNNWMKKRVFNWKILIVLWKIYPLVFNYSHGEGENLSSVTSRISFGQANFDGKSSSAVARSIIFNCLWCWSWVRTMPGFSSSHLCAVSSLSLIQAPRWGAILLIFL